MPGGSADSMKPGTGGDVVERAMPYVFDDVNSGQKKAAIFEACSLIAKICD